MKNIYIYVLLLSITAIVSSALTYYLKPTNEKIEIPRVVLANEVTGGFVVMTGVTVGTGMYTDLPVTDTQAKSDGWIDSVLCASGKGRYFFKINTETSEQEPYLLMYSIRGELIGVYFYTISDMPDPWKTKTELKPFSDIIIDYPHSNLLLYFKDPVNACRRDSKGSDGTYN